MRVNLSQICCFFDSPQTIISQMGRLLQINDDLEARVTALETQMVRTRRETFSQLKYFPTFSSDSLAIHDDGSAERGGCRPEGGGSCGHPSRTGVSFMVASWSTGSIFYSWLNRTL